jgi:MinD-like ATPase involved in chromosome partitioning or flagellar assembly
MNIVTMASRKGGAGKSTLTAHLASLSHQAGRRTVVIDADPQGSLTLWHSLRPDRQPDLRSGARGIERALAMAVVDGYEWAFIDTAASMWVVIVLRLTFLCAGDSLAARARLRGALCGRRFQVVLISLCSKSLF